MMLNYLSALWTSFVPRLGNHLWQSTLFAAAAGLLAFVLRRNHARARYWLWLSASVKFLFPFFLLVGIGSNLSWSRGSAETKTGLYSVMKGVSQPFTLTTMPIYSRAAQLSFSTNLLHLLPVLLTTVWFCGFLVVLCLWYDRWRRISAVAREAIPLREGREVKALRRIERTQGIQKPIEMRLSRTALEPGIFGIIQPVLIWPNGISGRLEDSHLEAILGHELLHVSRRDNLAAAIHVLVEAVFWFHPLVWWLGARLVEERERACDEEVLALGAERKIYVESILRVCEFCVSSPLVCMSGVTGADLQKRIIRIMARDVVRKLDFSRRLLLGAATLLAVGMPVLFGLESVTVRKAQSPQNEAIAAEFDVVSIKPDKDSGAMHSFGWFSPETFTTTGATSQYLIQEAYQLEERRILGAPSWVKSERYDIKAKVPNAVAEELRTLDNHQQYDQSNAICFGMLRNLLTDHFKLAVHREIKELPMFALIIAKEGLKLHEAEPGDTYPDGIKDLEGKGHGGVMDTRSGQLIGQGISISDLVKMLSQQELGLPVIDKTGLTGKYDFTLKWTPNGKEDSIFTAIQEQLGLKLEPQEGPVEFLVIDNMERPSEN